MKAPNKIVVVIAMAVVALGGAGIFFRTFHIPHAAFRTAARSTYYCPMHPTYTADRPGNCPICQMKLVKAEDQAPMAARDPHEHASEQFKSICYLHNCTKLHEGKPCPMTVVAKPGEKVVCPICGSHIAEAATPRSGERHILYWTDPMIPGYKASGPGKSPMGMDLVPVYEEEAAAGPSGPTPEGYAPVLLTPQKRQLIGVTTAPVQRRSLTKTIRAFGTVAHDPELYQAQQEFIEANRALQRTRESSLPEALEQSQQLVEAGRLRLRHMGLSEEMIAAVATSTQPDHRLLLGGAGQFWVYASIYEYELPLVRPGQAAAIGVEAFPDRTFSGTVKAIDPMLDATTRTTRVRILIEDPNGLLKPEMYVNVSIAVEVGRVLALPAEAVFETGTARIVFVDQGQGLFEPREVTLGVKADGAYEVKSGVAEGEIVVTSGNFLIDSESRLKAALQGAGHRHGQ